MSLATLNLNGVRDSDVRAAGQGAPTPKLEALLAYVRQHHITAIQDCAGIRDESMQALVGPDFTLMWEAPQHRSKGSGVAYIVATNIAPACRIIKSAAHGGLTWLQCGERLFGSTQPVRIANVYLPPPGQNHTMGEYQQRLEELQQDTAEYSREGPCIWMGDYNADIWGGSELQEGGSGLMRALTIAPELQTPRRVRGQAPASLKEQARALLLTARASDMLFLTGRKGDQGQATYRQEGQPGGGRQQGQSRVDHIAVSHNLWTRVHNSRVGKTDTTLSDHRPVEALFQPPSDGAVDLGRTEVGQPQGGESMLTWREERAGACKL